MVMNEEVRLPSNHLTYELFRDLTKSQLPY